MNIVKRYTLSILCTLCTLCTLVPAWAAAGDSVRFSLLTCAPGERVYELFGHTAIRYQNLTTGEDWVYNYGVFDFNAPNFVMRFVRGETDYQLGVVPFAYFEREYTERGSQVTEQVLRLSESEADRLDNFLRTNYLPAHRTYRYNYFYDNCTTRARDRIEEALGGVVAYPPGAEGATFRSWVHRCTKGNPWTDFGIGLCLGAEADSPISNRQQQFLPANLMQAFSHATVRGGGGDLPVRKLVASETVIIPSGTSAGEGSGAPLFTPTLVFALFLAVVLLCSWVEWRRQRVWWGIDVALVVVQGLAGCVLTFLFCCSLHPTVGSNWLVAVLNPLPLLCLPWMVRKVRRRERCLCDGFWLAVQLLFLAALPFIPQRVEAATVLFLITLTIRPALRLAVAKKRRRR